LAALAASSSQIALSWTNTSTTQTGVSIARSTNRNNEVFTEIATVSGSATSYTDSGLSPSMTYSYQVQALNSAGYSSRSNTASATTQPSPSGGTWQSADIGTSTAGQTSGSGDTVALTGSGRDIWNETDGFRYYYQSAGTGDCERIVRVASLQNTNGWAKAGIMLRESLDPGSRHAWISVSAAHGTALQYRQSANGETQSTSPSEDGTAPRWLKLVFSAEHSHSGEPAAVRGYVSLDGSTWTVAGNLYLGSTPWRHIGLAVTSHNDGALCAAQFDNVRLLTPPPPASDFRVARRGPNGEITLAWTYSTTDVDEFVIRTNRHRAGSHDWIIAATVPGNARQAVIRLGNSDGAEVDITAYRDFVRSPYTRILARPTITPSLSVTGTTKLRGDRERSEVHGRDHYFPLDGLHRQRSAARRDALLPRATAPHQRRQLGLFVGRLRDHDIGW